MINSSGCIFSSSRHDLEVRGAGPCPFMTTYLKTLSQDACLSVVISSFIHIFHNLKVVEVYDLDLLW